jgi:mRNA-degrading endonuclease HigB of HigAB toxin-antitoxin module
MKIAGAHMLKDLISRSPPRTAGAVSAWYAELVDASWIDDGNVLARFPRAAIDGALIRFDLGHDDHCAIVRVNYGVQAVLITYIGPSTGVPAPAKGARRRRTQA